LGWAGALAIAVLDREQLLAPVGVGADEDQDALPVVVEPRREVDAVGPDVDVAPGREVTTLPALMLLLPAGHQAAHGRGREAGRVGAEQRRERLLELAGGDALEVEPGQQLLDVLRPPQERRQHLRGEADALTAGAIATVTHLGAPHLDRADAGLDLTLGCVTVAHHPPPTATVLELRVRREERFDLGLDHLLQHLSGSRSQHLEQRIVHHARAWARQPNDGIFLHGVSSSGDLEHHRGYAAPALIHQLRP
jgi:hypothetical protein